MATTRPRDRRTSCAVALVATLLLAGGCTTASARSEEADLGDIETTTTEEPAPYGLVEEGYEGTGPEVVVLGDGILHVGRDQLRAALEGHAVKMATLAGEGYAGGPFSDRLESSTMPTIARTYAADDPRVAVLALGTADALDADAPLEEVQAGLDEVVAALEGACLVTVTVSEREVEGYDPALAAQLNARLREVGDQVVDWQWQGAYPGLSSFDDPLLPSEEGSRRLALLISDAVGSCTAG